MRFLLDTYFQADATETVADFEGTGLASNFRDLELLG
jgi:hypothetical protein